MAARGKAVSSAVSSGRHEITKGMRKTRSIGQDIEWWWKVSEVHIPDTKNALYRAFLDSLPFFWGLLLWFLLSFFLSSIILRTATNKFCVFSNGLRKIRKQISLSN